MLCQRIQINVLNTPKVRCNFRNVYQNLLQNDPNTWKSLAYPKQIKDTMSGFNYRIQYTNKGLSDGSVWMTLNTRNGLLKYGDICLLDFQMRTFNKIGWPYFGTVVYKINIYVV